MITTRTLLLVVLLSMASGCGSALSTQSDKVGIPNVIVSCDAIAGAALQCRAPVLCTDIYPCPSPLPDVTATATWSIDDPSIARFVAPGTLVAVGPGNTVVRAQATNYGTSFAYVAVFAGTTPLPTFGIEGSVRAAGTTIGSGGINGATVEVIAGLITGRRAMTGSPPEPVPGWTTGGPPAVAGTFIINGVPAGTIRLRATASGYQPLEQDVTCTLDGIPGFVDFQLRPTASGGT